MEGVCWITISMERTYRCLLYLAPKVLPISYMQVVLFVYDITNYASFDDLADWLEAVKKVVGKDGRKVHMGLVGNKGGCDCVM